MRFTLLRTILLSLILSLTALTNIANAGIIIIDNQDPLILEFGDWKSSTKHTGWLGDDYVHDQNAGKSDTDEGNAIVYLIGQHSDFYSGQWMVEMNWTFGPMRASNTPVDVITGLNIFHQTVDQTQDDGGWYSLGTYYLDSTSEVIIAPGYYGADNYVIADAFRFTSVPEPSTIAIFALGLMGLAARRFKKQA